MKKPAKKRVRLPREERLAAIMAVAKEVFIESGYEDASMIEVANRLDIVEGTIYRYFESKRELLVRVLEHWLQEALSDYDQHLAGISGSKNRLRFMVWHHLNLLKNSPELNNLLMLKVRSSADYEETGCYRLNQRYTGHVVDIVEEGIASGEFRPDTPVKMIRDLIFGGSEYYTWRFMTGRSDDLDVEQGADLIADLIYRSIVTVNEEQSYSSAQPVLDQLNALAGRLEKAADKLS